MRIVIDMQGAQTESRFRGIGRYSLSFAQAVARNRGKHEVVLALSGLFPDTIEPIRGFFDGLIPQSNIRVWHAPDQVRASDASNATRRHIAEFVREAFLEDLKPDIIHLTSLFEGYWDDAITSIRKFDNRTPTSVTLYDLIPLLNRSEYLETDSAYEAYYDEKISSLRQADLWLTISHHSRDESIACLGMQDGQAVNVSTSIDSRFRELDIKDVDSMLHQRLSIIRPFVLYTGGSDERKNLPRLIEAWAELPDNIRSMYQLVMAGRMHAADVDKLKALAIQKGLALNDLVFTGYITDEDLVGLYNTCKLYVFPSWHEGFGLPALEAMACGAAVIASNTTSLPEVVGLDDALFDPHDTSAITTKLLHALTDDFFLRRLRDHGRSRARIFSWDDTARRAIEAWKRTIGYREIRTAVGGASAALRLTQAVAPYIGFLDGPALKDLAHCLARNEASAMVRQVLVDVTPFCETKAASSSAVNLGNEIFQDLLAQQSHQYSVQLIQSFSGVTVTTAEAHPFRWQRGDVLVTLDDPIVIAEKKQVILDQLNRDGVEIHRFSSVQCSASEKLQELHANIIHLLSDLNRQEFNKQLLVDISELVKHDAKSGIQRVVRSILQQWLAAPPSGYRVEPVYATATEPYRYARQYIDGFLNAPSAGLSDDLVEVAPGDIFVCLDLQHQVAPAQKGLLQQWRDTGASVWSVVYDLLPLQFPDCFLPVVHDYHQTWLETITQFDGALCISKAVADELNEWLLEHPPIRCRPFAVKWFHLGADMNASLPTRGWPADGVQSLDFIKSRPSFLMVSTVEPRKGHEQVLNAFEQLWNDGYKANLVIVGKQGWKVDELAKRLRKHPEAGKRLIWLEGISDEFLEQVYAASTCLIVASKGEGFGLPLIEAAQHGLPIIARDLPVLREVAGEHAFYFGGHHADDLANAVRHWTALHESGKHPRSDDMPWLTWKESADQLLNIVLNKSMEDQELIT